MSNQQPALRPDNPNFSSGPTTKHPGWALSNLGQALLGRSHRSAPCVARLQRVIDQSKAILGLPQDYILGIMPGSDTGALEAALWSLLGARGVEVLAWDNFGKDWVIDVVQELKIKDVTAREADYGDLPDLSAVDFSKDVIFTWNGTTAGVKVPNGDWIDADRAGLTICDATSAIFAMPIDYKKCDVISWSWQKILGGEAAHGMLALSPRAVQRLTSYQPSWPVPKVFRLAEQQVLNQGIFKGSTINTPSMLCVEDAIDALNWVEQIGGLDGMCQRADQSLAHIERWVAATPWVDFMCAEDHLRSNTGVTFKVTANWFVALDAAQQKTIMQRMCALLADAGVAEDINGYPKAPPSFRVWCGGTVEPENVRALLPWIEWAYGEVAPAA